jgi:hypothetical protein
MAGRRISAMLLIRKRGLFQVPDGQIDVLATRLIDANAFLLKGCPMWVSFQR